MSIMKGGERGYEDKVDWKEMFAKIWPDLPHGCLKCGHSKYQISQHPAAISIGPRRRDGSACPTRNQTLNRHRRRRRRRFLDHQGMLSCSGKEIEG